MRGYDIDIQLTNVHLNPFLSYIFNARQRKMLLDDLLTFQNEHGNIFCRYAIWARLNRQFYALHKRRRNSPLEKCFFHLRPIWVRGNRSLQNEDFYFIFYFFFFKIYSGSVILNMYWVCCSDSWSHIHDIKKRI